MEQTIVEKKQRLDISSKVKLNNGVEMPLFGLGTYGFKEGGEVENAVRTALLNGYRKIDTATAYHNHRGIAEGIRQSGISREEIFLCSKVDNHEQGYQSTKAAFQRTLAELQTDYLDLYLIHWPRNHSLETWKAMEDLYAEGLIRAIGVSNFMKYHVEYFLKVSEVVPVVNQIEFHPRLVRSELHSYCTKRNIQVVAWRPIMEGRVNKVPELKVLARKYHKNPVQIALRWSLQKGIGIIPGAAKTEWIVSNADIFDFQLSEEDSKTIDSLDRNHRFVPQRYKISFLIKALLKLRQKLSIVKVLVPILLKKAISVFIKWDKTY